MKKRDMLWAFIFTILFASAGFAEDAAVQTPEPPPEPPKVQITVSQQVIDQQVKAYRGDLKEIVTEADRNLKKISGELKKEAIKAEKETPAKVEEKPVPPKKMQSTPVKIQPKEKQVKQPVPKNLPKKSAGASQNFTTKNRSVRTRPEYTPQVKRHQHVANVQQVPQTAMDEQDVVPVIYPATPIIEAPAANDEVASMYKDAIALYWENKYTEAQMKFEQVQKMSPEYARTSYYLGRIKEKAVKQ